MTDTAIAIFHGLGDCVNATTLLHPLKKKYPNSKIIWITAECYAPLTEHNPLISHTIKISGNPYAADNQYQSLKQKYKHLIIPAPYLNPLSKDNTLLGSFKEQIRRHTGNTKLFEPQMYLTKEEVHQTESWLATRKIKDFVMLETNYTSHQSNWKNKHTIEALKFFAKKNLTVILTHRSDKKIVEYNTICDTYCMDMSFRMAPILYNRSKGFVGVSSGISCVCHTNQCRKDIPHLEFVRGEHWCTKLYQKQNKVISFDANQLGQLLIQMF